MNFPLPVNEAERIQALARYEILDSDTESAFDRVTQLAARLLQVPMAVISLIDSDRQWLKSCVGVSRGETGRDVAFCSHAIMVNEVTEVPDTTQDARFTQNPVVTGAPFIRFYAGAPLRTRDGFNLGTLCVTDTVPRRLSNEEKATLADLAAMVVDEMEFRLVARRIVEESAERVRAEEVQRRSEAKFRLMIENGQDIITILAADGTIQYESPSVLAVLGYTPAELVGRNAFEFVHPHDQAGVALIFEAGKQENEGLGERSSVECRFRHKDGLWRWLEATGTNLLDNPDICGIVVNSRDITERKRDEEIIQRAQQEAEAARDEAQRANHAKSDFLARMSHELRTPLNAILGFGQLLEMDPLDEDQRESVGQIMKGGRHLLDLINEVLDIARIESGKLAMSPEPVSLDEAVREVADLVRPLAEARRINIEIPASCDFYALADRQRLKQVLLNLFSNAVKYNRPAGSVFVSCESAANGHMRIEVRDSGLGIAPDKMQRLFSPFERLGSEGSGIEGTGLGLALSKRLVEAMGGVITAQSTLNEGTSFIVTLPQARSPVLDLETMELNSPLPLTSTIDAARTVLYIEDNASNLRLLERVLERRPQIRLISRLAGNSGLEAARTHRPDLILLDLHLPDIDGQSVLRALRKDALLRDVPVVVISADGTAGQAQRLLEAGAQHYLTKPFDLADLLQTLDNLMP